MHRVYMLWSDYVYTHNRPTFYNDIDGSAALVASLQNYSQQYLDHYLVSDWTVVRPIPPTIYANVGAQNGALFPTIDSAGKASRFWIPGIRFDLFDTSGYYVDLTAVEDFTNAVLLHGSSSGGNAIGSIQPAHADTGVYMNETFVGVSATYKCISRWKDYKGRSKLWTWWQKDASSDILFAAQEYSVLAMTEYMIGQAVPGPMSPPEEGPGSILESARLTFRSAIGERTEINLPAPATFILARDGRHIDPVAASPLITDCKAYALSQSGSALTDWLWGVVRTYREPGYSSTYIL